MTFVYNGICGTRSMAGVAKWLRHWFVVSALGGSSPLACPIFFKSPFLGFFIALFAVAVWIQVLSALAVHQSVASQDLVRARYLEQVLV